MEEQKTAEEILNFYGVDVNEILLPRIIQSMKDYAAQLLKSTDSVGEQKWISVKERLPDSNYPVLVVYKNPEGRPNTVGISCLLQDKDIFDSVYLDYITHWQPLPDP